MPNIQNPPPKGERAQLNVDVDRAWKDLVDKAVRDRGLKLRTLVVNSISKELGIKPRY